MNEVTMPAKNETANAQMLKLVRYAARHADVATTKRDAAIREAHRAGASLREIAAQSGISHMSVKRIVERSDD
jgi:DNA-binding NarL/FixJ family response regulator